MVMTTKQQDAAQRDLAYRLIQEAMGASGSMQVTPEVAQRFAQLARQNGIDPRSAAEIVERGGYTFEEEASAATGIGGFQQATDRARIAGTQMPATSGTSRLQDINITGDQYDLDVGPEFLPSGQERGGDPYAAFKALFEQEFNRPITQDEMNSNKVLATDLGISNELFRLLPFERQAGFSSTRIGQLDHTDQMRLIESNPLIANDFPTSHWKNFSNDWLARTIGPVASRNNPAEWNNIVNQNKIGGEGGEGLPPELKPNPNAPPQGSAVPGNPGSQMPVTQPVSGTPAGQMPTTGGGAIPRFQMPTAPNSRNALDLFLGISGMQRQMPATSGTSTPSGYSRLMGDDDGSTTNGGGAVGQKPAATNPPRPSGWSDQNPFLTYGTDPNTGKGGWGFTDQVSARNWEEKFGTLKVPAAGSRATGVAGASAANSLAYNKERDAIELEFKAAEAERNQANLDRNFEASQAAQVKIDALNGRKLILDEKQAAASLGENSRQFDASMGQRQTEFNTTTGINYEQSIADQDLKNFKLQLDAAVAAGQMSIGQADQELRGRAQSLSEEVQRGQLGLQREQFDYQKSQSPFSSTERTLALRGQMPQTQGTSSLASAQMPAAGVSNMRMPVGNTSWQSGGGNGLVRQTQSLAATPVTQMPLTTSEVVDSPYTATGIKRAFTDMPIGDAVSQLPVLSNQDYNNLMPSEQAELDAMLPTAGQDPADYHAQRKRLGATGMPSIGGTRTPRGY